MIFSHSYKLLMSVTPPFDTIQNPNVNLISADFRTAFVSDPAPYSSVMNQYAIPPSAPIARMAENATRLAKYAESLPDRELDSRIYQGPYSDLSWAYGR